ncbi:major capsid protein [Corynebacterium mastitidis]|uniref:Phage major capsid protein n=1 Tax=Corynebacterium mastitidis TaxID=161890 RepID=A0A2N0X9F1_9CORY|nr:major capsid protein [Corynebacterium mastitidis]PKF69346.1 hypothetical protein CXB45_02395 [Corynebacterium mastitidis]
MSFYPGYATTDGDRLTVDQALKEPSFIEERIAHLAEGQLFVDQIFTQDATPVEGGAVIYGRVLAKHRFTTENPAPRQPGDEYQQVYRLRPEMRTAAVQDFGGKFAVTDEAIRRNRTADLDNDVTALTNTIVRKINTEAISALNAAIEETQDDGLVEVAADIPWSEAFAIGAPTTQTQAAALPAASIARALGEAETADESATFNRLIVTPTTRAALRICYGPDLGRVLDDFGLTLITTTGLPEGTALLVDQAKVGFIRYEEPLTVTTWRDEAHRQTWVQAYACPVLGITNPAALAVIRGVDGPSTTVDETSTDAVDEPSTTTES